MPSTGVGNLRQHLSALNSLHLTSKCQISFFVWFSIPIILTAIDVIKGKRDCPRNAASERTHVVHSSEGHAKAPSPWFSQARGHSQFNVLAVTEWLARRVCFVLKRKTVFDFYIHRCTYMYICIERDFFWEPVTESSPIWLCKTMPMKLESNERGCWSCRKARFVCRSARLLCRRHPAARALLLCFHLAVWYRPVGARRLPEHRMFSSVIVSDCSLCIIIAAWRVNSWLIFSMNSQE